MYFYLYANFCIYFPLVKNISVLSVFYKSFKKHCWNTVGPSACQSPIFLVFCRSGLLHFWMIATETTTMLPAVPTMFARCPYEWSTQRLGCFCCVVCFSHGLTPFCSFLLSLRTDEDQLLPRNDTRTEAWWCYPWCKCTLSSDARTLLVLIRNSPSRSAPGPSTRQGPCTC